MLLIVVFLAGIYLYFNKTRKSCFLKIMGTERRCGEVVNSNQIFTSYLVKIEKAYKSGDKLWLDVIINNKLFNNKATVLLGRFGTEEIQITDNLDTNYDFSKESVTQNVYDIDSNTVDIINNKSGHYALRSVNFALV